MYDGKLFLVEAIAIFFVAIAVSDVFSRMVLHGDRYQLHLRRGGIHGKSDVLLLESPPGYCDRVLDTPYLLEKGQVSCIHRFVAKCLIHVELD